VVVALALAATALASSGHVNNLVLSPSAPVAGNTVTFSWNGPGADSVTLEVDCSGVEVLYGSIITNYASTPISAVFPNAGTCTTAVDFFSYSGQSGNYQQKFSYSSFTVLP